MHLQHGMDLLLRGAFVHNHLSLSVSLSLTLYFLYLLPIVDIAIPWASRARLLICRGGLATPHTRVVLGRLLSHP